MKKPKISELFESENSSLRKTFDKATKEGCDKHNHPDCMKCFYTTRAESNKNTTNPEEKCLCACHQNVLKKPYEHDTKCCENMNGYTPTEK